MTPSRQQVRAVLELLLVSCLAVGCALNLARFRLDVLQLRPNRAAIAERRFEVLRRELAGRQRVGYITDPESVADGGPPYFRAQLALAPIVVELGTSPDLVVGNFLAGVHPSIPRELVLVRDFGDGVMLFQRR